MDKKLLKQAVVKFLSGLLLCAALLFLPAGTLRWPNAWLFLGVLFLPMFCAGIVMFFRAPELLRRRLQAKESQGEQRQVILGSALMFVGGFVLAALDFRFGWLPLPRAVSLAAAAALLLGYLLFAEVLRENAYLSRTVEVQEGQKVVSTGLYGVVRHPMYAATVLLFLSMPLVLGSLIAFAVFLVYPFLLVKRIRNEEAVLAEGLEGYRDYMRRVRWRLIPLIW